ncbi:hypothetical protein GQR58_004258 [Nymphon striatum]|nr:hypothetical protein GQR58_004258 [Nymphon striatum]
MNIQTPQTPDYTAIKTKQNMAWGSGDYAKVGVTVQITGEELAETLDLAPDAKLLDVAAGNGNATLAFARRFCEVTSTDYVQSLLDGGAARAKAEGLKHPEMLRVVKSGGKIGLANWTPNSFIGQLFKIIGKHIAPPPGVNSPAIWGSREWVDETFGKEGQVASFKLKHFVFRSRSPEFFVEYWREFYGPIHKAFLALDEIGQAALRYDIIELLAEFNTATDGTVRIPSEYAEIMIIKN